MRIKVGPACLVACLAIVAGGLCANWRNIPRPSSTEVAWIGEWRAPFLVASSIFGTQSFVSLVLIYVLKNMQELADCWGSKFQGALCLYAYMSLVGAVMYFFKYWSSEHLIVSVEGVGDYLWTRNLHWMVSTPTQWLVFGHLCTKVAEDEMVPVYIFTVMIHVFGIAMFFVGPRMRWFCFCTASWCFLECFRLAWKLKLSKDLAVVGSQLRRWMFIVWFGFPVAVGLRWSGCINSWQEQVLMFTFLDVVAKSVTFTALLVSRVVVAWARINGTVQLVLSSQDMTLEIDDNWQLLENATSTHLIAAYFGPNCHETVKMTDLCINEEHRARLIQAAADADGQQLGAPTPKVIVALRMPGSGGEMLAECLVSKCNHGRRILGVVVSGQAGNLMACKRDDSLDDLAEEPSPSERSVSSAQSGGSINMQMKLALHNCNDVLQLSESMRQMVSVLFIQSHTPCALFAWEEERTITPTIVVASPRLQELFFRCAPMPQPLTHLVSESMTDRILLAMQTEHTLLHQWRDVQSPEGLSFEVNMLPLKKLTSSFFDDDDACQVELCILVLVLADQGEKRMDPTGYVRWMLAGNELICDDGDPVKTRSDKPPRILTPLVTACAECLR